MAVEQGGLTVEETTVPATGLAGDGRPGLLDSVTVIDLGQIYNAPYATLLLAQAGARVIKVEPPGGERNRKRAQSGVSGAGFPFLMMNANKLGVTLNLKMPEGRDLLLEMAERADVLVENFRPGVMERLGLGPDVLHDIRPSLIYASSSGFGRDSPYGSLAAMDVTIQAMSGAMAATGYSNDPPVKAGAAIADFFAGVHLCGAIVTALLRQERTGIGAILDVAMMDAMLPAMVPALSNAMAWGREVVRAGNHSLTEACAPYGMYRTADGHVVVTVRTDAEWVVTVARLREANVDVPPGLEQVTERLKRMTVVDALVEAWTQQHTTEQVLAEARAHGVPCAPVRHLADVVADPYFRRRGLLADWDIAGVGPLPVMRSPIRVGEDGRVSFQPTPGLGQHNKEVYEDWLAHSPEEMRALETRGVV
jgi:formyl-CoA transferase